MITTRLRYHRPAERAAASALLAEFAPRSAVLGGGTMLVPSLTHRRADIDHVIDLAELDTGGIDDRGDLIRIGARVTYRQILRSRVVSRGVPLLAHMAAVITGGDQIRNQGTVGGSAAYNNPGSDVPGVLVASNAVVSLHGSAGSRDVNASDFFTGRMLTARQPDEFIQHIDFPKKGSVRVSYDKLKLSEGTWPIATASCIDGPPGLFVTIGAVQEVPLTVDLSEARGLEGANLKELIRARVDAAVTEPISDVLADADYRRDVAPVVAARAISNLEGR